MKDFNVLNIGGEDYSFIEKYSAQRSAVGMWINDKTIYRQVFTIETGLAKDNPIKVCDTPEDMDELLFSYGIIKTTEGSYSNNDILVYSNGNEGSIIVKQNFTSYPQKLYVIIEFTTK